ncbi:MAG: hypothetical protein ACMXYM_05230 [Candidatus Woesearchaeota archaeon]
MATTIQVSEELKKRLDSLKLVTSETYEDVIWDLVEDRLELSEATLAAIRASEEDVKAGRTISLEDVRRDLGI